MVSFMVLAAVFVFLEKEILCLKNVVLNIEPKIVEKGGESVLTCNYDTEGHPLYTVKFYRGRHEFYRYTPKEHPSTKIFLFEGIRVDLKQSNEHQVVLREVGFNLSGEFSCEVTTDAPFFSSATVYKNMLVVVLPKARTMLYTDRSNYVSGDIMKANCTSPPSRPPAMLTFVLNNMVVCENCVTRKHPAEELSWSASYLEFPLFDSHFKTGRLTLKCVAKIGDFYEQDTEIVFDNKDKDPIPARVTQSSGGRKRSRTTFVVFILWCVLWL